jgi:hypothetical protein
MTTIAAVYFKDDKEESIILASDFAATYTVPVDLGDVILKSQVQTPFAKIIVDKEGVEGRIAVAQTGVAINGFIDELAKEYNGETPKSEEGDETKSMDIRQVLQEADEKGISYFNSFMRFNVNKAIVGDGEDLDKGRTTHLIMATRKDGVLGLYEIFPFGKVVKYQPNSMGGWGSGGKDVREYLKTHRFEMGTAERAIDVVIASTQYAATQDPHSKGFDIYEINPQGIFRHGTIFWEESHKGFQRARAKVKKMRKEILKKGGQ